MLDLLIIGAGLAGLSAAIAAAKAGLRVRVIAKGNGATHWHAGTIDLLGYLPGDDRPVVEPLEHIEALHVNHPYRRLGADRVAEALRQFQAITNDIGLPYRNPPAPNGRATCNLLLPSPLGAARPTFLAPQAQLAGDLSRSEPMVIVGLRGWRDFFPKLTAANLAKIGHPARADFLPIEIITERRDFNTVNLAEALDQPAARDRLAAALKKLVEPGERVGLPAIVGLHRHDEGWRQLQDQLGAPVFEIPTLPPSVPGMRLFHALRRRLEQLGVRVEVGMEGVGFAEAAGQIRSIATATSARPLRHRADQFLLATGGVLGGGFNSDHTGRFWEVVFNLPLTVEQERSRWFRPQFLDAGGHPVFSGGVTVNERWQPVDPRGEPVYENLRAAGGLLAHADPIRQRSLEGLAIATGMAAAQVIAQQR